MPLFLLVDTFLGFTLNSFDSSGQPHVASPLSFVKILEMFESMRRRRLTFKRE
jgi:hypothetical protein